MPDHTDGTPQTAVSGSAGNQNQPPRPINYAAATKNGLGDPSAATSRSGSVQSVETAKSLDGRSPRGNSSRPSPKGSSTNHSEQRNGPVMSQQKVNSPSDKFIQSIIPSIGADTEVVTSNGSRIDGLFHSVSDHGDVVLQDAALTSRMGSLSTSGAEEIGEREELYLVSKNDFVEVLIKDVNSYPSPQMMRGYDRGFDSPQHSHSSAPLETDENLARASHGGAGGAHRELEEWNDNSVSFPTHLGDDIDDGPGYDVETMFRKNAMLSDKKSTFDDEMSQYTTVLRRENSVEFQQRMQRAGRIASEIEREKAKAKNRGRGQIDPEERDYADEEMVFSGVHRPDPRQNGPPAPPRNAYANQDARSSAPGRYPPPNNNNNNNNNNNRRGSSDLPSSFNSNKPDSNFPRSDSFQNERGRAGHNPAGGKDTLPSQWRRSEPPQPPSAPSPIQNPPSLPPVNQAAQSPRPPTVASPRPSHQAVKLQQQPPPQAATPPVKAVPEAGRPTFGREPSSSTSQNAQGPSPANQNVPQQQGPPPPVTQNIQSFNAGATVSPPVSSPASSREPYSHKPPQNAWQNQRRGTPTGDGSKGQEGRESQSVRGSLPVQRTDASQQQQPPPSSRPPQQGGQQPANRQTSNSSSQEKFESNSGGQRKSQSGERVERNDGRNAGNQGGFQQQQQQARSGASSGDERGAVRRQDSRQDGGGKEYANQGGQQWINSNTSKTFVNSNVVQNQNVRGNYQGSRGGNRNNNNRADRDNYQPRSKNASPSVIQNENRSREGSGSRRESVASADRESTGSRGGQLEGKPADNPNQNPNLNPKRDEPKTKDTKLNPDAAEFVPNVNAPEFFPSFAKVEQQPHIRTSPKRMSSGENLSMEQQQFAMQMQQAHAMVAYQQLYQQQQQHQQMAASQGGPGPSISPTNPMMMMLGPQGSYVSPAPNPQYAGQPMAPQQAMYAGAGQNSVSITQAQAFQAAQIAAQAHQQHQQQQQQSFQSVSPNILQQRPPNFAQMPNYPNQVYQAYGNPGQAPVMFVSPGYGGQGDPLMIPTTQMQYMSPHLQQQLQSNPMLYQFQAPPTGPYQSAGHPAGFLHMPAPPPSGYAVNAQYMQAAQMQPPVMNGNGGYPNMNMSMMAPPPNGGPNQGMVQQHMQSRGGPANQHGGQ